MRCVACHRRLLVAAYTAPSGWHLGPVCYEKERAAGRLPRLTNQELRRIEAYRHAAKRRPVKHIKRVTQVQDDLFCNGVENVEELD